MMLGALWAAQAVMLVKVLPRHMHSKSDSHEFFEATLLFKSRFYVFSLLIVLCTALLAFHAVISLFDSMKAGP